MLVSFTLANGVLATVSLSSGHIKWHTLSNYIHRAYIEHIGYELNTIQGIVYNVELTTGGYYSNHWRPFKPFATIQTIGNHSNRLDHNMDHNLEHNL